MKGRPDPGSSFAWVVGLQQSQPGIWVTLGILLNQELSTYLCGSACTQAVEGYLGLNPTSLLLPVLAGSS